MKKLILVTTFSLSMALSFGNSTTAQISKEVPGVEKTETSALHVICTMGAKITAKYYGLEAGANYYADCMGGNDPF